MKRRNIMIAFVIIVVLLVIFRAIVINYEKEEVIRIGAVLPLTGIGSIYGQYPQEGMEIALEEINSNEGINGKKLEIIYENSLSDTKTAVTSFEKLVNINNVSVVLVGAFSPETIAQAPFSEENKIVLLASGSAAPKIRFMGDYIFRIKVSVEKEMEELMKFAYNDLDSRKISILYSQNDYGEGIKESTISEFKKLNGEIINVEGFRTEEADFKTILTKIKDDDSDVVVLGGLPRNMGWILKQAKELNVNKQFISPAGTIGPEIIEIAESGSNGLIYIMEFNIEDDREELIKFKEKYKKLYGEDPNLFSAMGYDSLKLTANALRVCGDESECIKNNFYTVQNYSGASGIISFDEYGDVLKPMIMMTIKNEKFVRYKV
ncbi:ABC transporter substrate-binding protein [Candidatus Pacearchaeota archaeon]|nr:ABC transporter substrate-binding protein [Candidatus Pacearchaeota archaeon]